MSEEVWKPIPGAKLREVSNLGNFRSWIGHQGVGVLTTPKMLSVKPHVKTGYPTIRLGFDDGVYRSCTAATLVAEVFLGPRPEGMRVKPINGIKTDIRAVNLKYTNAKGGLGVGEDHPLSKLNYLQRKAIRVLYQTGEFSQPDLAEVFGVSLKYIWKIINTH